MADILLTHANHLYFDRKQVRKMQPYAPLQTILAAAVLRERGYEVALFDATLKAPEQGFRDALAEHQPRLVVVAEDNFNFLTKMCLVGNRELAYWMCDTAKRAGIPVVVNSSDATDRAAEYLGQGLDAVLAGELEMTLLDVAACLLEDIGSLEDICGLVFRDAESGRIRRTGRRELMTHLDQLPLPAWDLVDVESYRKTWIAAHGYFSVNMVSSRGCPYRCNWCAKPIYGNSYQFRSPECVADEMALLKTTVGAEHLWFADDIFALSPQWTRRFAEAVEARGAQIPFKMQSRCDLMTRDTVSALRRAGCVEVWMGAESGSQRILDAMEKGIRVEQVYQARENLRRHGIRACYFLQFGYLSETWEDIQETLRMVRESAPDEVGISVSYPLPQTRFYELVAGQLGSKANWSDSDDLSMMFQGTYTSEFYRALADALHLEMEVRDHPVPRRRDELGGLWARVRELEKTCQNANPTVLWTCS